MASALLISSNELGYNKESIQSCIYT